jgi:ABC-2 type transport system permease protein
VGDHPRPCLRWRHDFLTTQYLEEADQLADRIAVLDHGRLVAEGTAAELKRRIPGGHVRLQFADADTFEAAVRSFGGFPGDDEALTLQIPNDGSIPALRALLDQLDGEAIKVDNLSVHTPDLDDVFLAPHRPSRPRQGVPAMSSLSHAAGDSATMLRRNLLHALRYPGLSLSVIGTPIIMLLLFVYILGGVLGAGLGVGAGGAGYIDYVAPGIILMAATSGALSTAVSVSVDMTEGIINRFRTMAISRGSVLTGHVVGSVIQTMVSVVLVIAVALLLGFRPSGGPGEWLAAIGVLALLAFALTWVAVAVGLVAKTPETASNVGLPLTFLPFVGSGFVPTDSMPTGVRWFAEYQPFTPIMGREEHRNGEQR